MWEADLLHPMGPTWDETPRRRKGNQSINEKKKKKIANKRFSSAFLSRALVLGELGH
jgi:hypothetical protein